MATFDYQGHREVRRIQSPYDLERTQTWTARQEPDELRYEQVSTGGLLTGLHCTWDLNGRMIVRDRLHDEVAWVRHGEVFRYDDLDLSSDT